MTNQTVGNRTSSNSVISDRSLAIVGLAIAAWGILVLSEVESVVALKVILVVAAQVFAGSVAYVAVGKWKYRPLPELVGIGFAIGATLSVIADQLSRTSSFRSIAWALPFIGAVILCLIHKSKRSVNLMGVQISHANDEFQTAIGVAVFALFALTALWNWMIYPAIGTLPILIYLFSSPTWPEFLKSRYLLIGGIASTFALGAYAVASRPEYWWLPSWGIDENEILAHSIYNWGPNDYALSAGIPLKYQWTSHAWMGLVTHITGAGEFVIVSRAMFVITAIAIVCLVWTLALRVTDSARRALLATLVACVFSTAISYPVAYSLMSISYSTFAFICLLSFFVVLIDWCRTPTSLFLILVIFLAISAIAAKSVQIMAIGSGLAAVGVFDLWMTRKFKVFVGALTIGVAIVAFGYLTFPSANGTGIARSAFGNFTSDFAINPTASSLKLRLFVVSIILVSLMGVSVGGSIGLFRDARIRHIGVFLVGAFATGIPLAVLTTRVSSTQMHFIQVPIMLGIVPAVSWCINHFTELGAFWNRYRKIFWVLLVISFLAYPIGLIGRTILTTGLVDDYKFALFTNRVTATIFAFTIVTSVCAYLVCKASSGRKFPIALFMTTCLIASSVSIFFTSWVINPRLGINETGATYQLGQEDLREATDWAKMNTGIDVIFASNSFFGEGVDDRCSGSIEELSGPVTEEAKETYYVTTAVTLKRRLIAAGVSYAFLRSGDPTEKVRLSLLFACDPSLPILRGLQDFKVTWFLAYRNTIDPRLWSNVGKVRFFNDHYAVIELNQLS
jgi:hypothetical protein